MTPAAVVGIATILAGVGIAILPRAVRGRRPAIVMEPTPAAAPQAKAQPATADNPAASQEAVPPQSRAS